MSSNTYGENKVILNNTHGDYNAIMRVPWDVEGTFISRDNRFMGLVDISQDMVTKVERVHIYDPGRLEELLFPGNRVLLQRKNQDNGRKTAWDLIAAMYKGMWVFVNSSYHSDIAEEIITNFGILGDVDGVRREVKIGGSRLDFLLHSAEGEVYVEVKGCTLAKRGIALFPDAPTKRGKRHVEELMNLAREGKRAVVLFLVFRPDARCFSPNWETDPEFSEALKRASESGVEILPVKVSYSRDDMLLNYGGTIPVCWER